MIPSSLPLVETHAQELASANDFKTHALPLARIKKIMKSDEEVQMISAEAPVVFAKACELFINELTLRSWLHTQENKRRTLQRNDIAMAVTKSSMFDFLIDIVPREDIHTKTKADSMLQPEQMTQYYLQMHQQAAAAQAGYVDLLGSGGAALVDPQVQQHVAQLQPGQQQAIDPSMMLMYAQQQVQAQQQPGRQAQQTAPPQVQQQQQQPLPPPQQQLGQQLQPMQAQMAHGTDGSAAGQQYDAQAYYQQAQGQQAAQNPQVLQGLLQQQQALLQQTLMQQVQQGQAAHADHAQAAQWQQSLLSQVGHFPVQHSQALSADGRGVAVAEQAGMQVGTQPQG
mmetsp:Transcript_12662/g.33028  ORF Transcript_12662/g.33028 Transcript_12662/m.33028 type:complete len:340 (-) Transcript_12662:181-1200(-)